MFGIFSGSSSARTNDTAVPAPTPGIVINSRVAWLPAGAARPPWSYPHVAYFAGYTMWTYLTSPFIQKRLGVATEEIAPWDENGQT